MNRTGPPRLDEIDAMRQVLLRSMAGDAPTTGAKAATLSALGLTAAAAALSASASAASTTGIWAGSVRTILGSALVKSAVTGTAAGAVIGTAVVGASIGVGRWSTELEHGSIQVAPQQSMRSAPRHAAELPSASIRRESHREVSPSRSDAKGREPERTATQQRELPLPHAIPSVATFESPSHSAIEYGGSSVKAVAPQAAEAGPVRSPGHSASALPRETARLDRVRVALRGRDGALGLAELDRYYGEFSQGVLRPEADMLRIEALWLSGDHEQARRMAQRFIASHPTSPHVPRIRDLLGL